MLIFKSWLVWVRWAGLSTPYKAAVSRRCVGQMECASHVVRFGLLSALQGEYSVQWRKVPMLVSLGPGNCITAHEMAKGHAAASEMSTGLPKRETRNAPQVK